MNDKLAARARGIPAIFLASGCLVLQGGCFVALGIAAHCSPQPVWRLVALYTAAILPYLGFLFLSRPSGKRPSPFFLLWHLLAVALGLRLLLVPAPSVFSDDVYRYVWDGKVVAAGQNPYSHPPEAAELTALRDENWARINHRTLRTIYPPVSQALFGLLGLANLGPWAYKLLAALADLAVVALIVILARGKPRQSPGRQDPERDRRALWVGATYGLNPLACVESGMSGHLEPTAVALALATVFFLVRGKSQKAGLFAALGFGTKLAPGLLWPIVARRNWRVWLVFPAVVFTLFLPFSAAGLHMMESADTYARRWEGNAGLFAAVKGAAGWVTTQAAGVEKESDMVHLPVLDPLAASLQGTFFSLHKDGAYDPLAPGAFTVGDISLAAAKLVLGLLLVTLLAVFSWRKTAPLTAGAMLFGALVLVSPVVHPWYAIWVLPWAALLGHWPWYVLATMLPLSYLPLDRWWTEHVWAPLPWVPWVEYGLFAAAILAFFARKRLRQRASKTDPRPDPLRIPGGRD